MSEPMQHDDARLTAYALGELDAAGTAEVEKWLAEHPEAQAEIVHVREFGAQLKSALQQEPVIAGVPVPSLVPTSGEPGSVTPQRLSAGLRSPGRWQVATVSTAVCLLLLSGGLGAVWWASQPAVPTHDLSLAVDYATPAPNADGDLVMPGILPADESESQFGSKPLSQLYREAKTVEDAAQTAPGPALQAGDVSALEGSSDFSGEQALGMGGSSNGRPKYEESQPKGYGGSSKPGEPDRAFRFKSAQTTPAVRKKEAAPQKGDSSHKTGDVRTEPTVTIQGMSRPGNGAAGSGGGGGGGAQRSTTTPGKSKSNGDEYEVAPDDSSPQNRDPGQPAGPSSSKSGAAKSPAPVRLQVRINQGQPAGEKAGVTDEKLTVQARPEVQEETKLARSDRVQRLAKLHEEARPLREAAEQRNSGLGLDLWTETYAVLTEQSFQPTATSPLSTFALDVDTASYTNVRRFLRNGQWPPEGAIRVEEMVNYFRFNDPPPTGNKPFAVNLEMAACPWHVGHQLVRIGVRAREIPREQRRANLVFLLDVSGSMADANKLSLVKEAMKILTQRMTESDRVAIVTYSDTASVALESTTGTNRDRITQVIESLNASGSTNGAGGIQLAYRLAAQNFIKDGTNRVLLCTDGDFNVGISDDGELVKLISEKSMSGVFLSVFGFGMGNLKDAKLEKLADKGNGHYGYIDSIDEAQRMFVEQLDGTLYTVAKDVKTQVEFNPDQVSSYRLIGYENRVMPEQDFRDDAKDAGEIGSGHSVTVLYEIVPGPATKVAGVKVNESKPATFESGELFHVRMRYKQPTGDVAVEELFRYARQDALAKPKPSAEIQWAASVAAFGMVLRNSPHKGQASLALVQELAQAGKMEPQPADTDESRALNERVSRRQEFLELVALARRIQAPRVADPVPPPVAIPAELGEKEALAKAAVDGKYKRLLEKIRVPQDLQTYGEFEDYGFWAGGSYAGQDNLPQGYWVYVYPNWFLWGDTTVKTPPQEK